MLQGYRALLLALLLACQGQEPQPPGRQRDCSAIIIYQPSQWPAQAAVVGEFNGWDPTAHPLRDQDGDGLYTVTLSPGPGLWPYRLWSQGSTMLDPLNPLTLLDSRGTESSALDIPDCSRPALTIQGRTMTDRDLEITLAFERALSGSPLDAPSLSATLADGTSLDVKPGEGEVITVRGRLPYGKHWMTVSGRDRAGVEAQGLAFPLWVEDQPHDWRNAVIYQIVVDRFRRGGASLDEGTSISAYHGGDLWGVVEALEEGYFADLGVTALWVSPLYDNPDGAFVGRDGYEAEAYHGYWPAEPRAVEPRFGGEGAVEALVAAAHERGMRVIMDTVLNHIHSDHPYAREPGWFNHPEGDCICGFSCPWGTHMEDCWFDPFLPDLRWDREDVIEGMVGDALWWLKRFDLDGLRLDAVPMMPRLAMRHLRHRVARELEVGGTEVYLLGETYTGRGGQSIIRYYLGPSALSGQFDFPVMGALRDALAGRVSMTELDAEVRASHGAWEGSGAVMGLILGNHDVARFISDVNGDPVWLPREKPAQTPPTDKPYDLLRMAWTFLLTMPGAPVIYYGDEIGLIGASDPDNRRNMRFGDDLSPRERAVRDHVGLLSQARAGSLALRRGLWQTLLLNENLFVYGREAGDGYPVLVVLNRATVARELEIELPWEWPLAQGAAFVDLLGATASTSGRVVRVTAPPRASAVLMMGAKP